MKILDMLKNFWTMTGSIDVNPEEDKNTIQKTNKITEKDKALLLKTLQDVNKKTEQFESAYYTSSSKQWRAPIIDKTPKVKESQKQLEEDDLEL